MLAEVDLARQADLVRKLYRTGRIKTWYRDKPKGWRLVSGSWSPLYVQLRGLGDDDSGLDLLNDIGDLLGAVARQLDLTKLVGIANAGVPLAVSAGLRTRLPFVTTRKDDSTAHGEHGIIDGALNQGDRLAIVDDVATKLDTKIRALEAVRQHSAALGLQPVDCQHVLVVIDRLQYNAQDAKRAGLQVHGLVTLDKIGLGWLHGEWSDIEGSIIADYLSDSESFQDAKFQERLSHQTKRD